MGFRVWGLGFRDTGEFPTKSLFGPDMSGRRGGEVPTCLPTLLGALPKDGLGFRVQGSGFRV